MTEPLHNAGSDAGRSDATSHGSADCDAAQIERLEAQLAHCREAVKTWGELYREAVGVPESEHQRRRMEDIAHSWEHLRGCVAALAAKWEKDPDGLPRADGCARELRALLAENRHLTRVTPPVDRSES